MSLRDQVWRARPTGCACVHPSVHFNSRTHHPLRLDSKNIPNHRLPGYQADLETLRGSRIPLLFNEDIYPDTDFLALNPEVGYGLLRVMEPGERPSPRNIVIYESLPNELPRVGGIITTVPQTPLSHVNLRAVQDSVPNAYIKDAIDQEEIDALIDRYVRYEVTADGYKLRAATNAEVDAHHAASRPARTQTPERDLSVTKITPLSEVHFEDWRAFGVKAANVAVLGTLGFPEGTVPNGFAIPFHFYNEFMNNAVLKAEKVFGKGTLGTEEDRFTMPAGTKLIDAVKAILVHPKFQTDFEIQDEMLDDLREVIEEAESPQWMQEALTAMHAECTVLYGDECPVGRSLRYRSSTNNEDLPGFSGAGLYDSNTQKQKETEEEGIDKSMKQVFASLWNFRAFIEREFHRIDHLATAMGVLVHPNYSDELANGVAASFDPVGGLNRYYYLNTQLGEDLVTNPDANSEPEEILLHQSGDYYEILATSNQVAPGALLMSDAQMKQLAEHLTVIHVKFAGLYSARPFAIEIEFKITVDNILAIKQARPWVFGGARPTTTPTIGGGGGGGGGGPTPSAIEFEWTVEHDIEELDDGNEKPTGLWSDGETVWLLDNASGLGDAVYAYDLETGERLEGREFPLDGLNRAPRGIWFGDEGIAWVSDSGRDSLLAYDLATGERLEDRDIVLGDGNRDARGIWSDGTTMWVLNQNPSLFAYNLASGDLLAEYALDASNGDPRGIWSDGISVWVSDHGAKRLIAYRLPELPDADEPPDEERVLKRVRSEEFTELSGASNNSPRGIWSDGDVMYVADDSDGKVYTYNMPNAIDARLASLSLTGIDIGDFDPGRPDYRGSLAEDATETTVVTAEAMQRRAPVVIDPPDANTNAEGHQVVLEGLSEITVTVTSEDGSRERVYRVRLGDAAGGEPAAAACLRGAVSAGFSLLVYGGGSVDDLEACAESRSATALYVLHEGEYVSYILGAPAFVNLSFRDLYPDGLPALTPLIAKSEGPFSPDQPGGEVTEPWPDCMRGEIAGRFSLVLYEGGSVEDLDVCAVEAGVTALYILNDGVWVSYILGAPEFVNEAFGALFPDGLAAVTPLVVKSD